jgi:hypothetical protein
MRPARPHHLQAARALGGTFSAHGAKEALWSGCGIGPACMRPGHFWRMSLWKGSGSTGPRNTVRVAGARSLSGNVSRRLRRWCSRPRRSPSSSRRSRRRRRSRGRQAARPLSVVWRSSSSILTRGRCGRRSRTLSSSMPRAGRSAEPCTRATVPSSPASARQRRGYGQETWLRPFPPGASRPPCHSSAADVDSRLFHLISAVGLAVRSGRGGKDCSAGGSQEEAFGVCWGSTGG